MRYQTDVEVEDPREAVLVMNYRYEETHLSLPWGQGPMQSISKQCHEQYSDCAAAVADDLEC